MNKKRWAACVCLGFARNRQQGMTLIEVLIALGILAAVATVYLASMTTNSRAVIINQEQVTGENLAKAQMESIMRQPYDAVSPPEYAEIDAAQIPDGYDINAISVELMNPKGDAATNDDGLQKITITITRGEKTVFTLEGYKYFTGE